MIVALGVGALYLLFWPFALTIIWRQLRNQYVAANGLSDLNSEPVRVMHLRMAARAACVWPASLLFMGGAHGRG
jgi:hypothetical protein